MFSSLGAMTADLASNEIRVIESFMSEADTISRRIQRTLQAGFPATQDQFDTIIRLADSAFNRARSVSLEGYMSDRYFLEIADRKRDLINLINAAATESTKNELGESMQILLVAATPIRTIKAAAAGALKDIVLQSGVLEEAAERAQDIKAEAEKSASGLVNKALIGLAVVAAGAIFLWKSK